MDVRAGGGCETLWRTGAALRPVLERVVASLAARLVWDGEAGLLRAGAVMKGGTRVQEHKLCVSDTSFGSADEYGAGRSSGGRT